MNSFTLLLCLFCFNLYAITTYTISPPAGSVKFGKDVATNGNEVLITDSLNGSGKVYAYTELSGAMSLRQTIAAPLGSTQFGSTVTSDGDYLAVSSYGKLHLYEKAGFGPVFSYNLKSTLSIPSGSGQYPNTFASRMQFTKFGGNTYLLVSHGKESPSVEGEIYVYLILAGSPQKTTSLSYRYRVKESLSSSHTFGFDFIAQGSTLFTADSEGVLYILNLELNGISSEKTTLQIVTDPNAGPPSFRFSDLDSTNDSYCGYTRCLRDLRVFAFYTSGGNYYFNVASIVKLTSTGTYPIWSILGGTTVFSSNSLKNQIRWSNNVITNDPENYIYCYTNSERSGHANKYSVTTRKDNISGVGNYSTFNNLINSCDANSRTAVFGSTNIEVKVKKL